MTMMIALMLMFVLLIYDDADEEVTLVEKK